MANTIMVLGKSGTGKSSSIKGLDPKDTVVINILGKNLPFKGSKKSYNLENLNLFRLNTYTEVLDMLKNINNTEHVKNIIIDDCIYVMRKEYFERAKESGYNKYTELAMHFQQIITLCEKMKENINVFLMLHAEDIQSDKITTGYKVSTIGSLIDTQYNPIEVVPMVLYSDVKYDEQGVPSYGFYTHRIMNGQIVIPAKTPSGMFEEDFIPNDLGVVVKAMTEYYD